MAQGYLYLYDRPNQIISYAGASRVSSQASTLVFGSFESAQLVDGVQQKSLSLSAGFQFNDGQKDLYINRQLNGNVWWGTSSPYSSKDNLCFTYIIQGLFFLVSPGGNVSFLQRQENGWTNIPFNELQSTEQLQQLNNYIYGFTTDELTEMEIQDLTEGDINLSNQYNLTDITSADDTFLLQLKGYGHPLYAQLPIQNESEVQLMSFQSNIIDFSAVQFNYIQQWSQGLAINRYRYPSKSDVNKLWLGTSNPQNKYENWVYTYLIRGLFLLVDDHSYTQIVASTLQLGSFDKVLVLYTMDANFYHFVADFSMINVAWEWEHQYFHNEAP